MIWLRGFAFLVDWVAVAAWGGLVFGLVMFVTEGTPPRPASPWVGQGIGLLSITLPVLLCFAVSESSHLRGTLGKRVLGLRVIGQDGQRLTFGRALLRNGAKLAPWELGHTVAHQAIFSGEAGPPHWVWLPLAASFLGPLWWIAGILRHGRAPYDRWARAWVRRKAG